MQLRIPHYSPHQSNLKLSLSLSLCAFASFLLLFTVLSHGTLALSLVIVTPITTASVSTVTVMRSPQNLRNGGGNRPQTDAVAAQQQQHHHTPPRFHSTVAEHKLRRFNSLILVFRLTSFSFSLASSVFMLTNNHGSDSPHWYNYDTFRFVVAANAIVAVYSLFEMVASVWEISRGATLFPEVLQVWFDFGHDQVFAYLILSASAAGTSMVRTLRDRDTCTVSNAFCVQSDIAISLGYAAFLFLGFTSLLTGFRLVCFIINGSRFHL